MVTFEIYVASFWVSFEIQTADTEAVFSNLAALPNVRNIQVS